MLLRLSLSLTQQLRKLNERGSRQASWGYSEHAGLNTVLNPRS